MTKGERGGAKGTLRARESLAALKSLGVHTEDINFGHFRDGEVPYSHESICFLERFAGPEVVTAFIPPADDSHQDHWHAARSCLAAFRNVPSLLEYKTPSAIGFAPDVFVDITEHIDAKWDALQLHCSQTRQRKIFLEYSAFNTEAAAMGLSVGVRFAEGFQSVRYLLNPCPVRPAKTGPGHATASSRQEH